MTHPFDKLPEEESQVLMEGAMQAAKNELPDDTTITLLAIPDDGSPPQVMSHGVEDFARMEAALLDLLRSLYDRYDCGSPGDVPLNAASWSRQAHHRARLCRSILFLAAPANRSLVMTICPRPDGAVEGPEHGLVYSADGGPGWWASVLKEASEQRSDNIANLLNHYNPTRPTDLNIPRRTEEETDESD